MKNIWYCTVEEQANYEQTYHNCRLLTPLTLRMWMMERACTTVYYWTQFDIRVNIIELWTHHEAN